MAEWWSYGLSDFLMFSPRTWWRLVERGNAGAAPWLALAGGAALLAVAARRERAAAALGALLLAAAWGWVGWSFHWSRYAQVFLAAPWLAAGCWLQGGLLLGAVLRDGQERASALGPARIAGFILIALAVAAWPALTPLAGRPWSQAELAGLTPDPTALATLGWLLATPALPRRWRLALAVLPALSLAIGLATRWTLAQAQ